LLKLNCEFFESISVCWDTPSFDKLEMELADFINLNNIH